VSGAESQDRRATVVCVPRDHYHDAPRALAAVLDNTTGPYDLVYVLGRAPKDIREHVRREARRVGFTLVEHDEHLLPNRARNLAMAHVTTEYVAFVDNDVLVEPGWLDALVGCADDTGAAMVGPLQLYGEPSDGGIHVAGGFIDIDESATPHPIVITQRHQGRREHELAEPLVRSRCDFAEFHCLLARTDVVRDLGLDEGYLSTREVEDFALRLRAAGGECWFEPGARAGFLPPRTIRWSELGFLSRRWGERANRISMDRFIRTYGLDPSHDRALGHANGLRRPIFGPVRLALARLGAPNIGRKVEYALHRLERPVNRLLVRPRSG
jgi:hypothetical protein